MAIHSKARLFFPNKFEIMAKRNSMCLPDLSTILFCYQFVAVWKTNNLDRRLFKGRIQNLALIKTRWTDTIWMGPLVNILFSLLVYQKKTYL